MKVREKDIHSHLLPGVDDGFSSFDDAVEAISIMADNGCREFVFTPHLNPDIFPEMNEELLLRRYVEFKGAIPSELNVKTSLAAEYMTVFGLENRIAEHPETLLLHEDNSLLIEMSYFYRSPNLEDVVRTLVSQGIRPILAHPERYSYMTEDLEDYDRLRDMGCLFQINYLSLAGVYGRASIKILKYLSERKWCDFFASDLHSLDQLDFILDRKIVFPLRRFRKVL